MARRSKLSLALRRYWRDVKAGVRYRRRYTERHFPKSKAKRLKAAYRKLPKPRKPRKPPAKRPPTFIPFRTYREQVDFRFKPPVAEWHPNPVLEFGIAWVYVPFRYGVKGKRMPSLPVKPILPSHTLVVYFMVKRYLRGEHRWHIVGYRVTDADMMARWRPWTLRRWWAFMLDNVWEWVLASVDERNAREGTDWELPGTASSAIVLWHFVKDEEESLR